MPSYNHYTPQSDGSYRRSTVSEPGRRNASRQPYQGQQPSPSRPEQKPEPKPEPPASCEKPQSPPREQSCSSEHQQPPQPESPQGILRFLRGLLPRQIDAADLLVIALLLLMDQDEEKKDDDLSPLLTIALYFLL